MHVWPTSMVVHVTSHFGKWHAELLINLLSAQTTLSAGVGHHNVRTVQCDSVPGGGTLPDARIPSAGVAIDGEFVRGLREGTPAVIARAANNETILDLRTVDPLDDDELIQRLRQLLS
jgi:seryl-tRNA(Sec) selenium transferase